MAFAGEVRPARGLRQYRLSYFVGRQRFFTVLVGEDVAETLSCCGDDALRDFDYCILTLGHANGDHIEGKCVDNKKSKGEVLRT